MLYIDEILVAHVAWDGGLLLVGNHVAPEHLVTFMAWMNDVFFDKPPLQNPPGYLA